MKLINKKLTNIKDDNGNMKTHVVKFKSISKLDEWLTKQIPIHFHLNNIIPANKNMTHDEFHKYYIDNDIDVKNTDTFHKDMVIWSRNNPGEIESDDLEILDNCTEIYKGVVDDGWELVSNKNIDENDKHDRVILLPPDKYQYHTNILFKMILNEIGTIDPVMTNKNKLDFYKFCYDNTY